LAAIEVLDQAPPSGTDLDTWRRDMDAKQDAIEGALIDPNYVPGQAPAPNAAPGAGPAPEPGSDWYKPEDWTIQQNGQTVTIGKDEIPTEFRDKNVSNAKELVQELLTNHRYDKEKKSEYSKNLSDMQEQVSSMTKKMSEYEKQLAEAKKNPSPQANQAAAAVLPNENDIKAAQSELATIHESLDKLDPDDPESAPLMRKALRMQSKLQEMKDVVHETRFKQLDEERSRIKEESEKARLEREKTEMEARDRQAREDAENKMSSAIDTFTTAQKDLKLSKPFKTVEKEYSDWATDIAATYWGIPQNEVTGSKAEVAVQHFLNRTPAFITKLQDTGKLNRVPADLRKYLITTELYMMMQGQELDQTTGKWTKTEYRLPDMETAMDRWKRKNGLKYQDMVSAANKAESELLKVMNPPNVAEEIPSNIGTQAQRDMSKMSLPEAQNTMDALQKQAQQAGTNDLEEWIESISRRNPGDERVQKYNKAEETIYAFPEQK